MLCHLGPEQAADSDRASGRNRKEIFTSNLGWHICPDVVRYPDKRVTTRQVLP